MSIVEPRTLSGFMELLPPDQIKMERLMEVLRRTYSVYGFTPLDTPVIESSEVLLAKGGGETEKQVYRFQKGDSDLSLRFDLTVPLAKYVALHYNDLTFPFRRYQIGKVYRGERAQRGRFREFYQADIDVIGDGKLDIVNEAEIPAIIYRTFTELGLKNFKIHINNRKLLNGFYDMNGMLSRASLIMRTVDKLDKIGPEKVREILMSPEVGMYAQKADSVLEFTAVKGDNEDVFRYLEQMRGMDAQYDEGLDELHTIVQCLEDLGVPQENYTIDLSIARGLDYYTGTVYETIITSPCDVLVIPMMEDRSFAMTAAARFRQSDIRTQFYAEQKKFKAKMSYADKLKVPFAVILGEDEAESNVYSVKNMRTGEQVKLAPEEAVAYVQQELEKMNQGRLILDD